MGYPALCKQTLNNLLTCTSIHLLTLNYALKFLCLSTRHSLLLCCFIAGMTVGEMSSFCGSDADGWLSTSHAHWIIDKVNETQRDAMCFCLQATLPAFCIQRLKDQGWTLSTVKRLIFVMNVGKDMNNNVYIGNAKRRGSHWTLSVVDLTSGHAFYCDSLAWGLPKELLQILQDNVKFFNCPNIPADDIVICHTPTPLGYNHVCSAKCRNYSVQTCSDVCGVIACINAVAFAYDEKHFKYLTGPRRCLPCHLKDPTKYSIYLRRVLITWFMRENITPCLILLKNVPSQVSHHDHDYHGTQGRLSKRKRQARQAVSDVSTNILCFGFIFACRSSGFLAFLKRALLASVRGALSNSVMMFLGQYGIFVNEGSEIFQVSDLAYFSR